MTEQQWVESKEPSPMLGFLRGKSTERKLRLFAVACCVAVWERAKDDRFLSSLQTVERFAEGLASDDELDSVFRETKAARSGKSVSMPAAVNEASRNPLSIHDVAATAAWCADAPFFALQHEGAFRIDDSFFQARREECRRQVTLLADIFGNPFRHTTLNKPWLTPTAKQIAAVIYDGRHFDKMPILGDVLEEAGCDQENILRHCRQGGEHLRGCWVVDALLGKT